MKKVYALAFGIASFFAMNCGSGEEGSGYGDDGSKASASSETSGAGAVAAEVKILAREYVPAEVRVKKGQTVRWVWVQGTHDVVSGASCTPDNKFVSGSAQSKGTFEHTFDAAGTFPYFCNPHCGVGMTGKVIVEE